MEPAKRLQALARAITFRLANRHLIERTAEEIINYVTLSMEERAGSSSIKNVAKSLDHYRYNEKALKQLAHGIKSFYHDSEHDSLF